MKKFLQLFALLIPALAFGQTAVQKIGGGNNALSNGSIIVPSGVSITATGTGVIAATSLVGVSVNTTAPLTGGGPLTGSLTLAIPVATGSVNGYLSSADWTTFNAKQPAGNYITALTGDVTAAGPGSAVATLASVISASSVGSSTAIPVLTYDAKGRLTSTTTAAVIAPAGTLTGATLASNVLASSLTSVGTLTGGATGAGFTMALGSSTISGTLGVTNGGNGLNTAALGDLRYGSAPNTLAALAGNTSATMAVLTQTGNGTVSAAPTWTSTTGTGNVVRATSPSLVTPALGVASATSLTVSGLILGSGGSAPTTTTNGSNVFTAGIATSGPFYGVNLNMTGGASLGDQLQVVSTNNSTATLKNTSASGIVGISMLSSSAVSVAEFGYGNASAASPFTDAAFVYTSNKPFIFALGGVNVGSVSLAGNAAFSGNLTVSGSGTSSVGGQWNVGVNGGGTVQLGVNGSFYGSLSYTSAGNTTFFLDNAYDNAAAKISLRTRTLGTPITTLSLTATAADFTGITTSGTSTTAAAVLGKSSGWSENVFVGGIVNVVGSSVQPFQADSTGTSAAIRLTHSGGTAQSWLIQSDSSVGGLAFYSLTAGAYRASFNASGDFLINSATTATSSVGAISTNGGILAGKNIVVNSTTVSTSTTTGSGIFGGGLGVAGAGFFGGLINGATTIQVGGATNYITYDGTRFQILRASSGTAALRLTSGASHDWDISGRSTTWGVSVDGGSDLLSMTTTGALTIASNLTSTGRITASAGLTYAVAQTMSITSGTNQRAGDATLTAGSATVSNTTVTANTKVILTRKTSGGTVGTAITYSVSAGTSFTITSDNILDTSTFTYFLIEVP